MLQADMDNAERRQTGVRTMANIAYNRLPFMMVAIVIPERDMTIMMSHAHIDTSDPRSICELPTEYRNVSVITPDMRIDDCISIDTYQHVSIPSDRAFCVYVPPLQRDACGMPAYAAPDAMLESFRRDAGLSWR